MSSKRYLIRWITTTVVISIFFSGCTGEQPSGNRAPAADSATFRNWQEVQKQAEQAASKRDWVQAESLYTKVVSLTAADQKAHIEALLALGDVLIKANKLDASEKTMNDALEQARSVSPANMDAARALVSLAQVYRSNKKFVESEKAAREALAIAEKNAKSLDEVTLDPYVSRVLGVACLNGTCKDESLLTERLYTMRKKNFGEDDARTQAARQMFAELKEHHKLWAEAESLYNENLMSIGRTRWQALDTARLNLARVYIPQKKYQAAGDLIETVLSSHPDDQIRLSALQTEVQLLAGQGRKQEAAKACRERLALLRSSLGEKNESLAHAYFEYADLLREAGKAAAAKEADRQGSAIANQEKIQPKGERATQ